MSSPQPAWTVYSKERTYTRPIDVENSCSIVPGIEPQVSNKLFPSAAHPFVPEKDSSKHHGVKLLVAEKNYWNSDIYMCYFFIII